MPDPIVFGLDPGNSEATGAITLAGKPRSLTIPADIGAGNLAQLTRIRGGSGQHGRLAPDEHVLEVDRSSWFVGTLALEQSASASSAWGDSSRYWVRRVTQLCIALSEGWNWKGGSKVNQTTSIRKERRTTAFW